MDQRAAKALYRRLIDEAWNRGDLTVLSDTVHPEYRGNDPSLARAPGPDGIAELILKLRAAFDEFHYEVDDVIAEGDTIAARWTFTGVHTGEFLGIAGTGRKVRSAGMSFNRFRDGRLAEGWVIWDTAGVLRQLRGE